LPIKNRSVGSKPGNIPFLNNQSMAIMRMILGMLLIFLCFGCRRKVSPEELQLRLKNAMLTYLQSGKGYDSSKMKFDMLEVTYFEEPKFYTCEFKVHMHRATSDTTGMMMGIISKDFSSVTRKW
jgi:hypothetical protein